ncbi:glycogen synthase GlgA [Thioalkalivibrio sp. XN8]|uniref:glycogen synthase GlgA n=1 Tax=Thioalkalivibrio sp. XN8 TaxID=2712863 RepID=UPI0013ED1A37|nr:glycogen synthase GlgA [Thioalkalivibrio sp. XN8]NGP52970.1 glycogen synthase GlgA [Thioalkalivibrio sp. XN8]
MPAQLRILFVVAETWPLVKTGGLADVVPALARALVDAGHDVRLLLPGYREVEEAFAGKPAGRAFEVLPDLPHARLLRGRLPGYEIPTWLLHCAPLYDRPGGPYSDEDGRDWEDNALRFALLGKVGAMFGTARGLDGWRADVLHGHDWHAGLLPAYARFDPAVTAATVFTIHNLAYQGNFPAATAGVVGLPAAAMQPDGLEFYGQLSFMKAGLWYSDWLTTVSPTYARQVVTETYGQGMAGVLQARSGALTGILNGVDELAWNPATDQLLPARYSSAEMAGKARCKLELQDRFGLVRGPDLPLIGMVGRVTSQKGWDLLPEAVEALAPRQVQWALLGGGERELEASLAQLSAAHPGSVGLCLGYDEALSHVLIAGADVFAMPSRFEPSGLTQMYSQLYGTVPVVRRTGGLADSVVQATAASVQDGSGTGFLFDDASGPALAQALDAAVSMYRDDRAGWARLQANGMRHEFGWGRPAAGYAEVYREALAQRRNGD